MNIVYKLFNEFLNMNSISVCYHYFEILAFCYCLLGNNAAIIAHVSKNCAEFFLISSSASKFV